MIFFKKLFYLDKVATIKSEIEKLQERLRRAERAAENEDESDDRITTNSSNESSKDNSNIKRIRKRSGKRRTCGKKRGKVLVNVRNAKMKRIEKRRRKKLESCHEQYVGAIGTVIQRVSGSGKRVFDMKCHLCNQEFTKLAQHLVNKHKLDEKEAKLKESELRVMYLWASKDKHGIAKPLPCEICSTWFMRLDNHLVERHKLSVEEKNNIMEEARGKYWCSADIDQGSKSTEKPMNAGTNGKLSKTIIRNNGATVDYVPPNAKKLSDKDKENWGVGNDDFRIYYQKSEALLDAFKEELAKTKGSSEAMRYKRHVEYIWNIVDPEMVIVPKCALGNVLLMEDLYHGPTYKCIGTGNQASTLRVRFTALRAFVRFLRRRKVYCGISRATLTSLLEYVEEWNSDLTPYIAQRKTDLRKIKLKRLMMPKHMIRYGRSNYVQSIVKKLNSTPEKYTTRFAQQVRDVIICQMCIMNGLRASNIIELRLQDVDDAQPAEGFPGYMSLTNSQYKTSTIYGEKLIVLPDCTFQHLKLYRKTIRKFLNPQSDKYLFVATDAHQMSHGAIGSALTSSFSNARAFGDKEYKRVCPTRIRIACATFGCKKEGIDSGYFAKYFMKNKEDTTNIYYNLYSNHREALKLAMMMGDTFQVGGEVKKVEKTELEGLTNAIYACEKKLPSSQQVLEWLNANANVDSKEMAEFAEVLKELDLDGQKKTFYSKINQKNVQKRPVRKAIDEVRYHKNVEMIHHNVVRSGFVQNSAQFTKINIFCYFDNIYNSKPRILVRKA